jgi:hypothetical protein
MIDRDMSITRLVDAGRNLAAARQRQEEAYRAVLTAVVAACDAGVYEHEAARLAGIDRMTVRRARGKDESKYANRKSAGLTT